MELSALTAVSPVDGRYGSKTIALREIFSEFGLLKYRTIVEIAGYKALQQQLNCRSSCIQREEANKFLDSVAANFSEADAQRIKDIERTTNHDVKAVEYFLKEKLLAFLSFTQLMNSFTLHVLLKTSTTRLTL